MCDKIPVCLEKRLPGQDAPASVCPSVQPSLSSCWESGLVSPLQRVALQLTLLALDWGIYKHSSLIYELSNPVLNGMAKPCCCLGEASVKLKWSREQIQRGDKAAAVSVLGWAKNFGTFFAVDRELSCFSTGGVCWFNLWLIHLGFDNRSSECIMYFRYLN